MLGVRAGAAPINKSYQPLVYKTTNSGVSWSLMPGINFTNVFYLISRIKAINTNSNLSVPYFTGKEGWDAVVDVNDNLHLVCTAVGAYSNHNDSLDHIYSFGPEQYDYPFIPLGNPTIFDLASTASGWNIDIIDSMLTTGPSGTPGAPGYTTNPWSDGAGAKIGYNARIQAAVSVDRKKIFYSWSESDTNFTGHHWNVLPDIILKGKDIVINKFTQRVNSTEGVTLFPFMSGCSFFHYLSPKAIGSATTSTWEIPVTASCQYFSVLSGDTAVDHLYLKGLKMTQSDFLVMPIGPICNISTSPTVTTIQKETIDQNNISVFPNPGSEFSVLGFYSEKEENGTLIVLNNLGGNIESRTVNIAKGNNGIQLDLSSYSPGIYFIKLQGESTNFTLKLIKQ